MCDPQTRSTRPARRVCVASLVLVLGLLVAGPTAAAWSPVAADDKQQVSSLGAEPQQTSTAKPSMSALGGLDGVSVAASSQATPTINSETPPIPLPASPSGSSTTPAASLATLVAASSQATASQPSISELISSTQAMLTMAAAAIASPSAPQMAGAAAPAMAALSAASEPEPAELALLASESSQLSHLEAPKSDRRKVLEMFGKFFVKARSHDDQAQKEYVRDGVIMRLRDLGFHTSFLQKSRFEFRRRPAFCYNMVSILPGKHRQTKRDRIVLIGAHWDSYTKAPGVDDNGSGSTCLLEIARLISENQCKFNHTVMLVWFDYEEQGKYGSEFFVNDYLYPLELDKYNSKFIGAYILDMILVRDKENNTQTMPLSLKTRLTEFSDELEREKFRGDFLATWSRRRWDEPLENAFRSAWTDLGHESRSFKAMRPELPFSRLPDAAEHYDWKDFFRSDHASFWYPPLTSLAVRRSPNHTVSSGHGSLNAILLTDLGPWRKSYQKCYHSFCDDEHLLSDGNLSFMQQVVDTLVLTLLRVGQGSCASMHRGDLVASAGSVNVSTSATETVTGAA